MKTQLEQITPQRAHDALEATQTALTAGRIVQRPLNRRVIQDYANELKAGKFALTHQGLAFDHQGLIMDGRHRLEAIRMSGVSVELLVTHYSKEESQARVSDVFDTGFARGLNGQLQWQHGLNYATRTVAVINRLLEIACGVKWLGTRVRLHHALDVLSIFRRDFNAIQPLLSQTQRAHASILAPVVLLREPFTGSIDEFITKWIALDKLDTNSPILALNRWYALNQGKTKRRDFQEKLILVTCNALKELVTGDYSGRSSVSRAGLDWVCQQRKGAVKKLQAVVGVEKTL